MSSRPLSFNYLVQRARPTEGWPALFLFLGLLYTLVSSIIGAGWVPEIEVVVWLSLWGALLGFALAKGTLNWRPAWSLISSYAVLGSVIYLAELWPINLLDWTASGTVMRRNWAFFLDQLGGWWTAVTQGDTSQETLAFALGLGILACLLSAYIAWSAFRHHRPLPALLLSGVALGLNGYFGAAPQWPATLFVGLAILLTITISFQEMEQGWTTRAVDYSNQIQIEVMSAGAAIAMVVLVFALILPTINIRALVQLFQEQAGVQQVEEQLDRAFGGVQTGGGGDGGSGPGDGRNGRLSIDSNLPRAFLLGGAPELYETVLFTATLQGNPGPVTHWRGLSYDRYDGRGWAVSTERREEIGAERPLPLPEVAASDTLQQTVHWQLGENRTRFTLGLPLQFEGEVAAFWRGTSDLSRVVGPGGEPYTAVSRVSQANPEQLRQASLADVPGPILVRYTDVPDEVSERVRQLAQDVAGEQPTAYDQTKALEQFLRQYRYALDVEALPPNKELADYFLFELQEGYCDYYATSMVIMARALGLPARLAVGYQAQPARDGVQTIYQINSHSWAEIYFAGYGWVEFEPTAAFPDAETGTAADVQPTFDPIEALGPAVTPPPIPEAQPAEQIPWLGLIAGGLTLLGLALGGWLWQRNRSPLTPADGILWAYERLHDYARQLEYPLPEYETPAEFQIHFQHYLDQLQSSNEEHADQEAVTVGIEQLSNWFAAHRYGKHEVEGETAVRQWHLLRRRLRRLRWQQMFQRWFKSNS